MNQDYILASFFMLELTNCFQERLTFNVTYRTTDFYNGNFCILGSRITVETGLDFIGDVWDYLNGSSTEVSAAFLLQNGPVDLTGCYI